jgi:hypothetical protein
MNLMLHGIKPRQTNRAHAERLRALGNTVPHGSDHEQIAVRWNRYEQRPEGEPTIIV